MTSQQRASIMLISLIGLALPLRVFALEATDPTPHVPIAPPVNPVIIAPKSTPAAVPPTPADPLPADIKDMTNPTYLIDVANVHMRYGDVQRAQPLLKKALAGSKDAGQRESVLQMLRSTFQRTGNWKAAIEIYLDLLQSATSASERGKLNLGLADAYIQTHDTDKAEAVLKETAKPDKDRPDDVAQRQNATQKLIQIWQADPKRADVVVAETEANFAKDPNDVGSLELLIQIYTFIKHDLPKLNAYTEKLCDLKPNDPQELRKMAMLYLQDKKYDKAIEIDKKLMALATRHEDVRSMAFQIGNLLFQSGKKDESVAWIKENFAPGTISSGDFMLLASFYEKVDLPFDAEVTLVQWSSNAKTKDEEADAKMRIVELAMRRKDYDHAVDIAKTVLADFKDSPAVVTRANSTIQRIHAEMQRGAAAPIPAKPIAVRTPDAPGNQVPATKGTDAKPVGALPVPVVPVAPPAQQGPGADSKPLVKQAPDAPAK